MKRTNAVNAVLLITIFQGLVWQELEGSKIARISLIKLPSKKEKRQTQRAYTDVPFEEQESLGGGFISSTGPPISLQKIRQLAARLNDSKSSDIDFSSPSTYLLTSTDGKFVDNNPSTRYFTATGESFVPSNIKHPIPKGNRLIKLPDKNSLSHETKAPFKRNDVESGFVNPLLPAKPNDELSKIQPPPPVATPPAASALQSSSSAESIEQAVAPANNLLEIQQRNEQYFRGDYGGKAIPGLGGRDYPTFHVAPRTSFNCRNQQWPGYYADIEAGCQAFWICQKNRMDVFLCPNGTLFNQQVYVCDWWYNVDCPSAPDFYTRNQFLYRGPHVGIDGSPTSLSPLPGVTPQIPRVPRPIGINSNPLVNQIESTLNRNELQASPSNVVSPTTPRMTSSQLNQIKTPNLASLIQSKNNLQSLVPQPIEVSSTPSSLIGGRSDIYQPTASSSVSVSTHKPAVYSNNYATSAPTTFSPTQSALQISKSPVPTQPYVERRSDPVLQATTPSNELKSTGSNHFLQTLSLLLKKAQSTSTTPKPHSSSSTVQPAITANAVSSTLNPLLHISSSTARPSTVTRSSSQRGNSFIGRHPERTFITTNSPNDGKGRSSRLKVYHIPHGQRSNQFSNDNGQRENMYGATPGNKLNTQGLQEYPLSPSQQRNKLKQKRLKEESLKQANSKRFQFKYYGHGMRSIAFDNDDKNEESASRSSSFIKTSENRRVVVDDTNYSERNSATSFPFAEIPSQPYVTTTEIPPVTSTLGPVIPTNSIHLDPNHEFSSSNSYSTTVAPSTPTYTPKLFFPSTTLSPPPPPKGYVSLQPGSFIASSPKPFTKNNGRHVHIKQSSPVPPRTRNLNQEQRINRSNINALTNSGPTGLNQNAGSKAYSNRFELQQPQNSYSHESPQLSHLASQNRPPPTQTQNHRALPPQNHGLKIVEEPPGYLQSNFGPVASESQHQHFNVNHNGNAAANFASAAIPPQYKSRLYQKSQHDVGQFRSSTVAPRFVSQANNIHQSNTFSDHPPRNTIFYPSTTPRAPPATTRRVIYSTATSVSSTREPQYPTSAPEFASSEGYRRQYSNSQENYSGRGSERHPDYKPEVVSLSQSAKSNRLPGRIKNSNTKQMLHTFGTVTPQPQQSTTSHRNPFLKSSSSGHRQNPFLSQKSRRRKGHRKNVHSYSSTVNYPSGKSQITVNLPTGVDNKDATLSTGRKILDFKYEATGNPVSTAVPDQRNHPSATPTKSRSNKSPKRVNHDGKRGKAGRYAGAVKNKSTLKTSYIYADSAEPSESVSSPLVVTVPPKSIGSKTPVSTSQFGQKLSSTAKKKMSGAWTGYFTKR